MFNLSTILEENLQSHPNKDAFIFGETAYSYKNINAAANQVANALDHLGIKPGDKVAVSCLNLPYFPIIYYGILKFGAVVVPLSVLLKADEIGYALKDADAKAYFCFEGNEQLPMGKEGQLGFNQADQCETFILVTANPKALASSSEITTLGTLMANASMDFTSFPTKGEDTAVIIYTSGTTGEPKGAELTHNNLFYNANLSKDLFGTSDIDRQIIALPLFHIFAMTCQLNAGIYAGLTSVLLPKFDPDTVFDLMIQHEITFFCGVPTMYWALLNSKKENLDLDKIATNLRLCVSGGASLPVQVLKDFEERFNVSILEGYGMSEGSPVVTFNRRDKERKAGSIGTAVWGVEVMVADENDQALPPGEKGQILYRGHNVMKGYYKKPAASAKALKDGWMHSGDVGFMDEQGYFYIVDRTTDLIIRGGYNVYPREIEEVIIKHDAVSLVAVIGIPDEEYGEEIKAYIVLKDDAKPGEEEIINWSKEKLANYKYPRVVEFVKSLPMSATGKILKKELRKQNPAMS